MLEVRRGRPRPKNQFLFYLVTYLVTYTFIYLVTYLLTYTEGFECSSHISLTNFFRCGEAADPKILFGKCDVTNVAVKAFSVKIITHQNSLAFTCKKCVVTAFRHCFIGLYRSCLVFINTFLSHGLVAFRHVIYGS